MTVILNDRTHFHFEPGHDEKSEYLFVMNAIANAMQRYFPQFDIYAKLKSIEVFHPDHRSQALLENNAIGLAYFDGRIELTYFGGIGDNSVVAMEFAHNIMLALLPGPDNYDEMNNWIHFAANRPYPTIGGHDVHEKYIPSGSIYRRKLADLFAGRPGKEYRLFWYNMPAIFRDGEQMNAALVSGTAPAGPNPYWNVSDQRFGALKGGGIVPGSVEEDSELQELLDKGPW